MALSAGVTAPRVLFVYFSYTQQSLKVAEAMAEVLRQRGCEVRLARIELIDRRYAERITRIPLRHSVWDIVGMMPAQLRGATGEIRIPDEAKGDYDLIIIGSPTWWLKTSVPIRSFLKSDTAARMLSGKPFAASRSTSTRSTRICARSSATTSFSARNPPNPLGCNALRIS